MHKTLPALLGPSTSSNSARCFKLPCHATLCCSNDERIRNEALQSMPRILALAICEAAGFASVANHAHPSNQRRAARSNSVRPGRLFVRQVRSQPAFSRLALLRVTAPPQCRVWGQCGAARHTTPHGTSDQRCLATHDCFFLYNLLDSYCAPFIKVLARVMMAHMLPPTHTCNGTATSPVRDTVRFPRSVPCLPRSIAFSSLDLGRPTLYS